MSSEKRRYELRARAVAQEMTRARIAAAASALHEEVGVAATTVADIARRAGVSRLTIYNHFPDLAALLPACTEHWMAAHPMPDLGPLVAAGDLRGALELLYGWYREGAALNRRLFGERSTVPELDAWLARTSDVALAATADAFADAFDRALAALALDFWTWDRLDREGLSDADAAALMAAAAAGRTRPAL